MTATRARDVTKNRSIVSNDSAVIVLKALYFEKVGGHKGRGGKEEKYISIIHLSFFNYLPIALFGKLLHTA